MDKDFFLQRIGAAVDYRKSLGMDSDAIRWVHSEADQLPGLIVDQYADCVVLQCLTQGMERCKAVLVEALQKILKPKAMYERNDSPSRGLEGLPKQKGWLCGEGPTRIAMREGPLQYWVDIENGHKTGFYLDQRENRHVLNREWAGRNVLDCFCYSGGFSLAAAKNGAKEVLGLDIAQTNVDLARENAKLNGLSDCHFQQANVFDMLRQFQQEGRSFDAVILDPPSFTRSKGSVDQARKGYKEIHLRALKILNEGGLLLTFSCSYHLGMEDFQKVVLEAARDARRMVKVRHWLYQAKDHPVLLGVPETLYLKGLVLQVQDA